MNDDAERGTLGWDHFFSDLEARLDALIPSTLFPGDLYYSDGSGVDTSHGYGVAAIRALRLAIALSQGEDGRG